MRSAEEKRLQLILAVLCGAIFLDAMDASTVNIALPAIGRQLHLQPSLLQWVVSGYVLGYGGFLLLGGRASDLLGRRKVFLVAVTVFALASCLGGVAQDGTTLIAARCLKGIAAGFTVPAALSILTTTFAEGPERHKALGAYGVATAMGFLLGLVIGGLLSQIGWRWVFFAPVPFGLLVAFVGMRIIPVGPPPQTTDRKYDIFGAATITVALVALVYSIVEAPTRGWTDGITLGGFGLFLVLLAAFVVIELNSEQPLVRLGILRNLDLLSADLAAPLFFGSFTGYQFLATLYVQDVAHWSPVMTSIAFLAMGPFLPTLGAQAEKVIGRFGTTRLIAAALLAFTGGYALFAREQSHALDYATMMLPTLFLVGLGWGLGFPALNVRATVGVPDHEQGLAAGLFNTALQVGGAIGVAVASAVLTSHGARHNEVDAIVASIRPTSIIVACAAFAGAALITVVGVLDRGRKTTTVQAEPEPSAA